MKQTLNLDKNLKKFQKKLQNLNQDISDDRAKNLKSDREIKKWTSIEELKTLAKKMNVKVKKIAKKYKAEPLSITTKERGYIQDHLIIYLYTYYFWRNDFVDLIIKSEKEYNNLEELKQKTLNYLIYNKYKSCVIKLNNYKTVKFYDPQNIVLKKEFSKCIRRYLKFRNLNQNTNYLLINQDGSKMERYYFSHYLSRITDEHIQKKVTSSIIRHVAISEILPKLVLTEDKIEFSRRMMHSPEQSSLYLKVDDPKLVKYDFK